ncbi:MAG: DUF4159 domain-containing protein [Vicinamibacterales bacterium]
MSSSRWSRVRVLWVATCLAIVAFTTAAPAQRFGPQFGFEPAITRTRYDGKFALARLKYTTGPGGYYYMGLPAWAHGYPKAENNLLQILDSITAVHPHVSDTVVVELDDPELMKYPVAYMTEAGFWVMNNQEAAGLRAYFLKGGFVIFDDFRDPPRGGGGWANFEANMMRVLPGVKFFDLDASSPIFHCFFDINELQIIPQFYDRGEPILRAIYQDNDPGKRLIAVINFNTDVSNFWEFSGTGIRPVPESNEAYKLGVNYIIYGLTH